MLNYFKELKECLYIYNNSSEIYGLTPGLFEKYVIILEDSFEIPRDKVEKIDKNVFVIYKMHEWFEKVLNCDIECWECSCTRKPIKEHVKLIMSLDLLKLRKSTDYICNNYILASSNEDDIKMSKLFYWKAIKNLKFANQIIENHKILNYKSAASDWDSIKFLDKNEFTETAERIFNTEYKIFKSFTDGVVQQEKLNKIRSKLEF